MNGSVEDTLMSATAADLAEQVIATLRAHQAALQAEGIAHLSLFGSVARGEADSRSDVDLAAVLDLGVIWNAVHLNVPGLKRDALDALSRLREGDT